MSDLQTLTLPFVFLSGMLGSAHCIGMCGGIAATMSLGATSVGTAMARQLLWSAGRTFTYCFLGMIVVTVGSKLLNAGSQTLYAQAAFALLAGVLLIGQGLHAAGWLSWRVRRRTNKPCLTTSMFAQFLKGGSPTGVLVAGVLTGFLPCGLVYSFLALAASSGSLPQGIAIMVAFGLGTVPIMLLTGMGFSMATLRTRQQLLRVAAICVIITGMMTFGRGIAFASASVRAQPQTSASQLCPLCDTQDKSISVIP